jgi:SecD/SecF fusion protein
MRLATRIRHADPLYGTTLEDLTPPPLPPGQKLGSLPAGRRRIGRRLGVAATAAIACVIGVLLVALLPTATHKRSGDVVQIFHVSSLTGGRVSPALIARSAQIIRGRLASLNATDSHVAVQDSATIRFYCAGCASTHAVARRAAETAKLLIYDWEPNVLNSRCRPAPTDANVTGGQAAGQPGAGTLSYYRAILRAAKCQPRRYRLTSHHTAVYYAIDPARRRVLSGPQASRADALTAAQADSPDTTQPLARLVRIPPGVVVLQAADGPASPQDRNNAQWYVLRDNAALSGRDIIDPRRSADRSNSAPLVSFTFSASGGHAWRALTRGVAQRGQLRRIPGRSTAADFQHFAIALDTHLITVPFIDFQRNPDGIDPRSGSKIEGGLTDASARALVALLRSGSLPAQLTPTSTRPATTQ